MMVEFGVLLNLGAKVFGMYQLLGTSLNPVVSDGGAFPPPPTQTHISPGAQTDDPKGLFWILDEEALIQGSSDSTALDRLCSFFAKEGLSGDEGKVMEWGACRLLAEENFLQLLAVLGWEPGRKGMVENHNAQV